MRTLAGVSDLLVLASILVYVAAFVLYAVATSQRLTRNRATTATRSTPTPVRAGAADPSAARGADPVPTGSSPGLEGPAGRATLVGFGLNVAAVLARAVAVERAPWGNMYEFAIVGAVAVVAAYLVMLRRQPVSGFGVWVVGLVLLVLGLAVTVLYTPADDLIPVLDSYWLVIHVAAAIAAGGAFTVAAVSSALYLVQRRREQSGRVVPGSPGVLPSAGTLDRVTYALVVFAFPVWTFAVMAGAVWAENAWGRYWGWDPKETWAFITWVLYAAYLHAQSTAGWRGTRASWLSLAGFAAFLFNFVGVNIWLPGLHSYAGV